MTSGILGTGNFLKRIVRHVVAYDKANMQELCKLTLDMALLMQEELEIGEFMYNEMKLIYRFDKNNSASTIASISSNTIKNYLRLTAFRTLDIEVRFLSVWL